MFTRSQEIVNIKILDKKDFEHFECPIALTMYAGHVTFDPMKAKCETTHYAPFEYVYVNPTMFFIISKACAMVL